jgi:tRNA (guanosine-2'-O-)-methyltransferase
MAPLDSLPPGDPARNAALRALLEEDPLAEQVTERRKDRIVEVVERRLASVTVVMENLYDPHNVSAVVRTAEGFGLDAVHVVEQPNRFQRNPAILRGADRWVRLPRHPGLNRCLSDLMAQGFLLCAADVGEGTVPIHEVPVDRPVAIVLGSERDGLSKAAKGLTDVRFSIPMAGFTESFNVSVSAALALFDLSRRRRELLGNEGDLGFDAVRERALAWLHKSAERGMRGRSLAPRLP